MPCFQKKETRHLHKCKKISYFAHVLGTSCKALGKDAPLWRYENGDSCLTNSVLIKDTN